MAPHGASAKELEQLRTVFQMFDKDGSGSIDMGELKHVLKSMGHFPNPAELAELMERMDANKNGVVDFGEFAEAMLGQQEDEETEAQLREMQEVFALFDTDGSGQLSADELQRALKILGVTMTRPEVELLIREIDADGDGEVSCDELLEYVLNFDVDEGVEGGDVEGGRRLPQRR